MAANGRRILIAALGFAAAASLAIALRLLPDRFDPLAPLDPAAPLSPMTPLRLWLMDEAACLDALRRAGIEATLMPDVIERPGCSRSGTVTLSRLGQARLAPEEMRCGIALRLALLERHVIQPAARRRMGSAVTAIEHFGSYACRTIRGRQRLSEHATANAFDIAGFRLADGRQISLRRDWNANTPASGFLREVRDGACDLFNLVLSPDYNADHADHFHFDMGLYRSCR